jgi:uncharacterized protein YprB with RNaseH-like and TPR domain
MSGPTQDELQAQIALLRRKMAAAAQRVEQRMVSRAQAPLRQDLCLAIPGQEVTTQKGCHWESERLFDPGHRHGNMELARLQALPHDLLGEITQGQAPPAAPETWAFLDTETTGLAGGAGTCAFLIGIGRIRKEGFAVRQFFMRDFPEEASQLHAVAAALQGVDVLITYNGKCFDLPLLESRYRMARARPPFATLAHLDLLYGARRLWRLRLDSCRLVELESQILGHQREDDIPGELIPQAYFDWVRDGRLARLAGVFAHNTLDIVSLACLTGIVPWAFRDPAADHSRHAAESVALGRWLRQTGNLTHARDLFRAAIRGHLREELLCRTLWDLAEIELKLGSELAAIELFFELSTFRNAFQGPALVALAKHYEHRRKDYAAALEATGRALSLQPSEPLTRRKSRLENRLRQLALPSLTTG